MEISCNLLIQQIRFKPKFQETVLDSQGYLKMYALEEHILYICNGSLCGVH